MDKKIGVIKKNHQKSTEYFDIKKLGSSITKTCFCLHIPDGQAEAIAKNVCAQVEDWVKNQPEVTTKDIREVTSKILVKYHPEAAYLYKQRSITI